MGGLQASFPVDHAAPRPSRPAVTKSKGRLTGGLSSLFLCLPVSRVQSLWSGRRVSNRASLEVSRPEGAAFQGRPRFPGRDSLRVLYGSAPSRWRLRLQNHGGPRPSRPAVNKSKGRPTGSLSSLFLCLRVSRVQSFWSGRRVSNPRPQAWEARALPTELRPPRLKRIPTERPRGQGAGARFARLRVGGVGGYNASAPLPRRQSAAPRGFPLR